MRAHFHPGLGVLLGEHMGHVYAKSQVQKACAGMAGVTATQGAENARMLLTAEVTGETKNLSETRLRPKSFTFNPDGA